MVSRTKHSMRGPKNGSERTKQMPDRKLQPIDTDDYACRRRSWIQKRTCELYLKRHGTAVNQEDWSACHRLAEAEFDGLKAISRDA